MSLAPGTRLGPYELVGSLGAGGMGEVYRARDTRLGRDVAVKVIQSAVAADPAALLRFEQESRAVSLLNHPNILALYDVGTHGGIAYLVTELLVGRSLRAVIADGSLTRGKALEYGVQIARGLAAAHEQGIVHRDLKPENVFVSDGGHVKLLDFGLAKLAAPSADDQTLARQTSAGMILGTVGYMSPEQVRGHDADTRSDIFSFGALLYELLGGKPPFKAETSAESMTMILREDPAPLANVPGPLAIVVRRCLEKNPGERLQSAHDLALTLEAVGGATTETAVVAPSARARWTIPALLALLGLAIVVLVWAPWRSAGYQPDFHQLTFRRGPIRAARFAPGGQEIVYSAAWAGEPNQIYVVRPDSPDSRMLGLSDVNLFAVSRTGELAISVGCRDFFIAECGGTLARVPLAGGTPKQILEDVRTADWLADGQSLAVARQVGDRVRVEFPAGTMVYESPGWISSLRVAPQGDAIVFAEHPAFGDYGTVTMVDRAGRRSVLTKLWNSLEGVAWSPDGNEVWFAAAEGNAFADQIHVVTRAGRERTVLHLPGTTRLYDVGSGGRLLLTRESWPSQLIFHDPKGAERDLSWLDAGILPQLSADGQWVAFTEAGMGAGAGDPTVFIRKTDGSPPSRITAGFLRALSADARWVLAIDPAQTQLSLVPTGAGAAVKIDVRGFEQVGAADLTPDVQTIVFIARRKGEPWKLYSQALAGGEPRAVSGAVSVGAERFEGALLSRNGQRSWVRNPAGHVVLIDISDGTVHTPAGLEATDAWVGWADASSAYVRPDGARGRRVVRVDLTNGTRKPLFDWQPADPVGLLSVSQILVTPDGQSYLVWVSRGFSDLFLADTHQ